MLDKPRAADRRRSGLVHVRQGADPDNEQARHYLAQVRERLRRQ